MKEPILIKSFPVIRLFSGAIPVFLTDNPLLTSCKTPVNYLLFACFFSHQIHEKPYFSTCTVTTYINQSLLFAWYQAFRLFFHLLFICYRATKKTAEALHFNGFLSAREENHLFFICYQINLRFCCTHASTSWLFQYIPGKPAADADRLTGRPTTGSETDRFHPRIFSYPVQDPLPEKPPPGSPSCTGKMIRSQHHSLKALYIHHLHFLHSCIGGM